MKKRGKQNPISPDEIIRIKNLKKQGLSNMVIGKKLGRSDGTVSYVVNGKNYNRKSASVFFDTANYLKHTQTI